jgi:radical SAM protein with 4Fe4S-binding SPASM domain
MWVEIKMTDHFAKLITIFKHVSSDFPGTLIRAGQLLWERTGDFNEAFNISKHRLLAIFFETTDFCNAHCIMCASNLMRRTRQIMPMDAYRTAVEQLVEVKGHSVMLSAFAEPLLDPYIVERVKYASQFPVIKNIGFSTNGSLLTGEKYRELAEAGLKTISISIDGFHKETYEKIRVGLSFKNLEKNIAEVLKVHESLNHPIALTVSSFTRETPRQLAKSALYKTLVEAGIRPGLKWRVDNWGGLISKVSGGLWLMDFPVHRSPCALLYDSSFLVLPDGRVTPCHCRDLEGDLYIGNVKEDSPLQIWRGGLLRALRREQWEGKFRPPCARCSAYITLRKWFTKSIVRWILTYNERVPIEKNTGMVNTGTDNNAPGQRVMTTTHGVSEHNHHLIKNHCG